MLDAGKFNEWGQMSNTSEMNQHGTMTGGFLCLLQCLDEKMQMEQMDKMITEQTQKKISGSKFCFKKVSWSYGLRHNWVLNIKFESPNFQLKLRTKLWKF